MLGGCGVENQRRAQDRMWKQAAKVVVDEIARDIAGGLESAIGVGAMKPVMA